MEHISSNIYSSYFSSSGFYNKFLLFFYLYKNIAKDKFYKVSLNITVAFYYVKTILTSCGNKMLVTKHHLIF